MHNSTCYVTVIFLDNKIVNRLGLKQYNNIIFQQSCMQKIIFLCKTNHVYQWTGAVIPIPLNVDISSEIAKHVADILTGFAKWNMFSKIFNGHTDQWMWKTVRWTEKIPSSRFNLPSTGDSINIVFACEEMESLDITSTSCTERVGLMQLLEKLTYVDTWTMMWLNWL